MGNCCTQPIGDYPSYYAFEFEMKKYFPADGCTIAVFVDRSQSNVLGDDVVRNPLRSVGIYPMPATTNAEREKANKHWLPEDLSYLKTQIRHYLSQPAFIAKSPILNSYLKVFLLLASKTLKTAKSPEVIFHTFGGNTERSTQVTCWGTLNTMSVIDTYCYAISESRSYGRETGYQGVIEASTQLSAQIQVPLISIIITDGILSEHCRQATEEAFAQSSQWPIVYIIIVTHKSPQVTTTFLSVKNKKFDNVHIVYFDDIQTNLTKWNEDPAILMEVKAFTKVVRQFQTLTKLKLMYNLRKDRPVVTDPNIVMMPTSPLYSSSHSNQSASVPDLNRALANHRPPSMTMTQPLMSEQQQTGRAQEEPTGPGTTSHQSLYPSSNLLVQHQQHISIEDLRSDR